MTERIVAVLAGGLSHEREVSLRSGRRLAAALRGVGSVVREWDADAVLIERLRTERPDAVVVALHGGEGENGSVQAVLELLGVPFVGTPSASCRRAWDKPTAKAELARAGLDTPDWVALPHATFRELGARPVLEAMVERLGLPMMLKPDQGGSALGAQVVTDAADLPAAMVSCLAYADTVLAERFVSGVEVAVSVVEDGDGPRALPPGRGRGEGRVLRLHRPLHAGRSRLPLPEPPRRRRAGDTARDGARRPPPARPAGRIADGRGRRTERARADSRGERVTRA